MLQESINAMGGRCVLFVEFGGKSKFGFLESLVKLGYHPIVLDEGVKSSV
jgi:hypothetical protein